MQVSFNNKNFYSISPSKIHFEGYKSVFSKQLDEFVANNKTDNEEIKESKKKGLISRMKSLLAKKVDERFELGEGCNATVYKIDDSYILKLPYGVKPHICKTIEELDKVQVKDKRFAGLKTYYGEPVAVFGDDIEVIKNVSRNGSHFPVGVPLNFSVDADEAYDYYNLQYLPKMAQLPQRAFDNLAKDMALLNSMRDDDGYFYQFDYYNPNNFVIAGNSIRVVDEINNTIHKNANTTLQLLSVLVGIIGIEWGYPDNLMYDSSAVPLRQEILKKIILAGEKYDLPICKGPLEDKDFNKILMLCEPNKSGSQVLNDISRLRSSNKDKSTYLSVLSKYLDNLFIFRNTFESSFIR